MVAGKVKMVMGLQKSPGNSKHSNNISSPKPPSSSPSPTSNSSTNNSNSKQQSQKGSRTFGGYFPRSSAQVQPRPPDVSELLRLVEELRERESRLRTELLEHKLLKETVAIVPVLENQILSKDFEIEKFKKKIDCLEAENEQLRKEMEFMHSELKKQNVRQERKVLDLEGEIEELKKSNEDLILRSCTSRTTSDANVFTKVSMKPMRKCFSQVNYSRDEIVKKEENNGEIVMPRSSSCSSGEIIMESSENVVILRSRVPHVPKPPPRPSVTSSSSSSSSLSLVSTSSSPSYSSMADSAERALAEISNIPPPPPPPPKVCMNVAPPPPPPSSRAAPPPPPPLPAKGLKGGTAKVRRVPEVVEFYHSLMRRDTRRESGCGAVADGSGPATAAKDMIGEIENRSAYLLAIKTDVETQGDFIRFLIKEVENAVFADIEDVVPFVKWLDDELSFLVDERAVLKHFDWPEKKADALREAAFGYCDLKKLESQASSFRDDLRQPSASALKKMQGLFEKLEHGVYTLSRMRESAANRYKSYNIPTGWMQDTGFVSQIKWASVKLAMKYMKRISSELETVGDCGPEEEELIVQGVRFAFRVHQFAGGFDVDTMRAFQELRDKAKSFHVQWQNQLHQKTECKSTAF